MPEFCFKVHLQSDLPGEYRILSEAKNDNYGMEYDYGSITQYNWRRNMETVSLGSMIAARKKLPFDI
ncbi:hypothetical protein ANCCAN_06390 [Ancylostoma caninum]|uniref:Uncharacterized protein n=1 Tax=Ancylostoma caninum TaxID=29170 RepID=A0A368GSZ8_ANCCA|nr:hypothetical protein ANCCAN_06390 [Ancylostoma caninum]